MTVARVRAVFPAQVFRTGWSSAAFLFYLGAAVVVIAIVLLIGEGNGEGNDFALFGWASLGLAAAAVTAGFLRRTGHVVLAGLAAFVALVVFGVWFGAFEDWIGLFPDSRGTFFAESRGQFEGGLLLLEVVFVAAGLFMLRVFRFPLLTLAIAAVVWFACVDNGSALFEVGDDGHAVLSVLVGLLLITVGIWLDRYGRAGYGFWLHVVGGLALGGGLLELLDHGWWRWTLLGLVSLAFVTASKVFVRSSYAVIGAVGVLLVGGHFIEDWFGVPLPFPYFIPFFFFGDGGESSHWDGLLAYVVLGVILAALGLALERGLPRRRPVP